MHLLCEHHAYTCQEQVEDARVPAPGVDPSRGPPSRQAQSLAELPWQHRSQGRWEARGSEDPGGLESGQKELCFLDGWAHAGLAEQEELGWTGGMRGQYEVWVREDAVETTGTGFTPARGVEVHSPQPQVCTPVVPHWARQARRRHADSWGASALLLG